VGDGLLKRVKRLKEERRSRFIPGSLKRPDLKKPLIKGFGLKRTKRGLMEV